MSPAHSSLRYITESSKGLIFNSNKHIDTLIDEGDRAEQVHRKSAGGAEDDAEVMKKHLRNWDILRTGVQFINSRTEAL